MMVAEGAGLWRAPSRARDEVPTLWQRFTRHARHRIAVDHRPGRGQSVEADKMPAGRRQRKRRHAYAREMVARAIVHRYREIRRQLLVAQLEALFLAGSARAQPTARNAIIGPP